MSKGNNDAEGKEETHNSSDAPQGKAESVKKAIELFETKLREGKMKPTVAEYVRLLELQKEIDGDELREIKVTWVEPVETES
jgi:hypothetical protein